MKIVKFEFTGLDSQYDTLLDIMQMYLILSILSHSFYLFLSHSLINLSGFIM